MQNWKVTNSPKWIIGHHTGGTDANPLADTSKHTASTVENWHLKKGWDGIGYHYFISLAGTISQGRPEHVQGAHAIGYNRNSIGICLAGNFDATMPSQAQEIALRGLLKELTAKYSIPLSNVVPHRKFANKSCYGKKLSDSWARDLVVAEAQGLDNFSTLTLLKEARGRGDFWSKLVTILT